MNQKPMTILEWLNSLRPAIPYSAEKPKDSEGRCLLMSNGEIKRQAKQGAILINGERFDPFEPMDFPVHSLVFFPNSAKRRTTII
jgi:hypothetical protein